MFDVDRHHIVGDVPIDIEPISDIVRRLLETW